MSNNESSAQNAPRSEKPVDTAKGAPVVDKPAIKPDEKPAAGASAPKP
jgi:hypothetical protein